MASPGATRQKMVASAAVLIREHGASATSIDRVLAHSGAPRGSVYHHFPGGRVQLVEEAVRHAGARIADLIEASGASGDPLAVIDDFVALWRRRLESSDFRAGCPVVAVAVESHDDAPGIAEALAGAFGGWRERMTALLTDAGIDPARAVRLATFVIAAVEGAVVMCRAERSYEPLESTAAELRAVLAADMEGPR